MFWPRAIAEDARALWDTREVFEEAFAADWRALSKTKRFTKWLKAEVLTARKRAACVMCLGGVFEEDPDKPSKPGRGPPLMKISTRGWYTFPLPAKPAQPSTIDEALQACGYVAQAAATAAAPASPRKGKGASPQKGEPVEADEEPSTEEHESRMRRYMYMDTHGPLSPRSQTEAFFVPSLLRAACTPSSPDAAFARAALDAAVAAAAGAKGGNLKADLKSSQARVSAGSVVGLGLGLRLVGVRAAAKARVGVFRP